MYVSKMVYHSSMFIYEFKNILSGPKTSHQETMLLFKSIFGVTPHVCSIIWKNISTKAHFPIKKIHLMWALHFLRQYGSYKEMTVIFGVSRVTISKYIWKTVHMLADMQVVSI